VKVPTPDHVETREETGQRIAVNHVIPKKQLVPAEYRNAENDPSQDQPFSVLGGDLLAFFLDTWLYPVHTRFNRCHISHSLFEDLANTSQKQEECATG